MFFRRGEKRCNRMFPFIIEIVALSLVGYGCAPGSPDDIPVPGDAESVVEQAKEDLAKRLDIDKDEIVVKRVESVEWPDASLGCPEPGKMYAQVITPGHKIFLSYEEETYPD